MEDFRARPSQLSRLYVFALYALAGRSFVLRNHFSTSLRNQSSETQIINDIFHLSHFVLDAVTPSSQRVILEVENLETGMKVFDELADHQWSLVVAERHRIARKTSLFSQVSA